MTNLWWLFALGASLFSAIYIYSNQIFKLKPATAMMYRTVVLALCLLPFMPFFKPVESPIFYILCIIQGIIVYYIDAKLFKLSKTIGAEATGLYQPLSIALIFFIWIPISFYQQGIIYKSLPLFLFEVLMIATVVFSIIKIKKAQTSSNILLLIAPAIILATFADIFNKLSMQNGGDNLFAMVYYYNFITAATAGIFSIHRYQKEGLKTDFIKKKNHLACAVIVGSVFLLAAFKNMAMLYTPDPTYVSAIIAGSVLLILLLNRILKAMGRIKTFEKIDVKYAFMLIASVCTLIIISSHN